MQKSFIDFSQKNEFKNSSSNVDDLPQTFERKKKNVINGWKHETTIILELEIDYVNNSRTYRTEWYVW